MDYFIGIDVSKKTLDLAVLKEGSVIAEKKIENNASSLRAFIKESGLTNNVVVCMEHTGIYSMIALEVFWKKGVKICVEPALRIKLSQGMTRGKTDKIDARRIAIYAFKNQQELRFWKPQRIIIQKIRALIALRERLLRSKTQLEVSIKESVGFIDKEIIKEISHCSQAPLAAIRKSITRVEAQLKELINLDPQLGAQVQQITSVPGIGPITAINMIIATDEFTRINDPKKFACYAGVAPFEHSSGSSIRGKTRVSTLANMNLKTLLHLSAMAAIRSNADLKAFYQRKVAEGKNKMSVINAVRNKLVKRAFACVAQKRLYQENYQNPFA